jgi:hypothetical protein
MVIASEHQIFGYKEKVVDFTLQVLLKSFFVLFPESLYLLTFFLSVGGNKLSRSSKLKMLKLLSRKGFLQIFVSHVF